MKLTNKDKDILKKIGHKEEDFAQIQRAISKTIFKKFKNGKDEKEICLDEVLSLLSREDFLSGIGRSAFHFSSVRDGKDGICVYFDSSKLFK